MEPALLPQVEERHRKFLKEKGNADELAGSDLQSALEMYKERGQWEKCLEKAKTHSVQLYHKYVAVYAAEMIKKGRNSKAVAVFAKYGTPLKDNVLNIYRHLAKEAFEGSPDNNPAKEYARWASLRQVLAAVSKDLQQTGSPVMGEFENIAIITHYLAMRAALKTINGAETLTAKISTTLLRYINTIPADRAFFDAGIDCRDAKRVDMALMFMNRDGFSKLR